MRKMTRLFLVLGVLGDACSVFAQYQYTYQDTSLSYDTRVADMVSRMTLAEKFPQMGNNNPSISRIGLPGYMYWNEALHGVARYGTATVFPQAIAMSATWDPDLILQVASAISDEGRVKNMTSGAGLTWWSPVINMSRDPRWGRTEEGYGEDVYLMSRIAVSFVKGLQGNNPRYLKAAATPKHFACNNKESDRESASANTDQRSLREYFLPAFKACIVEGKAYSIMAAYNAVNGVPCPADTLLLRHILRNEWGFKGFVVSDCDAVGDVYSPHHYVSSAAQAAAVSLLAGTDMNCGGTMPQNLATSISSKLCTEADMDVGLRRQLKARFLFGEFDPPSAVPYRSIPTSKLDCQANRDLCLKTAREAIVLLKNDKGLLPLNKDSVQSVAVIGPNANTAVIGDYSGTPPFTITTYQAISSLYAPSSAKVTYAQGCTMTGAKVQTEFDKAVNLAKSASVAVVVVGTDESVCGEGSDRSYITLPGVQEQLIQAVYQANPKTVVVLVNGYSLAINWTAANIPAIVCAWYGGESQGTAIADALFGAYNPGGKLSSTWYSSLADLPSMDDYHIMNNRTYMYFTGTPIYPFGFGLSYTTFAYDNLAMASTSIGPNQSVTITANVKNTGSRAGDEVAQMYIHEAAPSVKRPIKELKGFQRLSLTPGQTKTATFTLSYDDLAYWDSTAQKFVVNPGAFDILVGTSSADIKLRGQITAVTGSSASGPNIALQKTAKASSSQGTGLDAGQAVDGSVATRWASDRKSDSQWVMVDLGAIFNVNRIILNWDSAFAQTYKIQVALDTAIWSNVFSTSRADGGLDDLQFPSALGRYVRVFAKEIGYKQSIALKEFEVYGRQVAALSPVQRAALMPLRIAVAKTTLILRNLHEGPVKITVWNAQGRALWAHAQQVPASSPVLAYDLQKEIRGLSSALLLIKVETPGNEKLIKVSVVTR
jgi:beta-glucosidase